MYNTTGSEASSDCMSSSDWSMSHAISSEASSAYRPTVIFNVQYLLLLTPLKVPFNVHCLKRLALKLLQLIRTTINVQYPILLIVYQHMLMFEQCLVLRIL